MQLVSVKTVEEMTTLSRATIYRMVKRQEFPEGIMLTANRRVWELEAVQNWIQDKLTGTASNPAERLKDSP